MNRRWIRRKPSNGNQQTNNQGQQGLRGVKKPKSKSAATMEKKIAKIRSIPMNNTPGKHRLWDTWDLDLAVWNVEGKGSPEEVEKAIKGTMSQTPAIVCLQEANLPTDKSATEHFVWHCSGTVGQAVLINKELTDIEVVSCESVCEQIYIVDLKNESSYLKVISCCMPPSTSYICQEVWEKLTNVLKSIPTNVTYLLAGDFNAEIGKSDSNKVPGGGFGTLVYHDTSNENGIRLVNLVRAAGMRVSNTFNPVAGGKDIKHFTYKDGETKVQRSFVILSKNRKGICKHDYLNRWTPNYKHALLHSVVKVIKSEKFAFGLLEKDVMAEEKMVISTWNVHGASPAKVDTVLIEQKLEIACVQEMFLTSADDLNTENYNWYSMAKPWVKNVAIVVKKSLDIKVEGFEVLSESLCAVDIVNNGKTIKIISCFWPLPTDPKSEAVRSQLSEMMKSLPKESFFVVAGDFNVNLTDKSSEENAGVFQDNTKFLAKLVEETNTCMEGTLYSDWNKYRNYLNSRATPNQVGRPHQILMSRHYRVQRQTKLFTRWIPFFENAILSLFTAEPEMIKPIDQNLGVKCTERIEIVDGQTQKIKELDCFALDELNEENLISEEDREKFKTTLPSAEDLGRLFKDFVIYYKPTFVESNLIPSTINILATSFKEGGKFGKFIVEDIENFSIPEELPLKRECRIKWQGITLVTAFGKHFDHYLRVMKKCGQNLMASLGQTCYTVKPKKVYFNRGCEPALPKDEKLNEVFRMVNKKDYPTMPQVMAYIEEFFSTDTDCELAFGPEFTKEEQDAIKAYAEEHKLDSRYFTSSRDQKLNDHLAIFNHRSPQEIRDQVIENGDDPKFTITRPSGIGVDYVTFCYRAETKHMKSESKVLKAFWDAVAQGKELPQDEPSKTNETPKVENEPTPKRKVEMERPRESGQRFPTKRGFEDRLGGNVSSKRRRQNKPRYEDQYLMDNPWRSQDLSYMEESRYNDGLYMEESLYNERERMPEDRYFERNGMNQDIYDRQDNSYNSQFVKTMFDTAKPLPKQHSNNFSQTNSLPRVNLPQWHQCAPLIVVWPVTIQSHIEERRHIILEENFPTEYIKNQYGVAVLVTLPMRNGNQKKFCLSVGHNQKRATHDALDLIVKHSTVIKPSPTYLCDGSAPNFVRYNVPCQTNPRTYIILTKNDTGPLTEDKIHNILQIFQESYNEDVFFDNYSFTFQEKTWLMEIAPKYQLKARHFGDAPGVVNRWVCIYKKRPKEQILEEVLKMRGNHPKYMMTTDRLPPRVGLNIF